jgi:hypothetical protein
MVPLDRGNLALREELDRLDGEQAEVDHVPGAHGRVTREKIDHRERVLESLNVGVDVGNDGEARRHVGSWSWRAISSPSIRRPRFADKRSQMRRFRRRIFSVLPR